MQRLFRVLTILALIVALSPAAFATNGVNLIGIGPIARSMGGVGIAAPQDAISAVFANPAAMCFGPYCPSSEFDFAATLFAPDVEAKAIQGGVPLKGSSKSNIYPIPAIGISTPLSEGPRAWRFGIAAYGVSGLGVDYRGTDLNGNIAGDYSELQQMKFAPTVAYQVLDQLSLGVAVPVNYTNLDLRNGASSSYSIGVQVGLIYMPIDNLSLGLNYTSPQKDTFDNVLAFAGNQFDLDIESPQQIGFGVAYKFFDKLLVEVDGKWINWSGADGFEDFDWDDQWVIGIGLQFEVIPNLFVRAGYNYGENPVNEHNGWNPAGITTVQGIPFPNPAYESFRIIGLPAIVQHHLTLGGGYEFSDTFSMHLGYVHAFEETITESTAGGAFVYESTLSENSLDFGLTWRF